MSYNKLQALRDNTAAIKTAWEILSQQRARTEEDIEVLRKYSGFGGIKEVLNIEDYQSSAQVEEDKYGYGHEMAQALHDLVLLIMCNWFHLNRHKQIIASIKQSVLTAFYTPKEVIAAVGAAVKHVLDIHGVKAASFLETSAGIGGFLPVAAAGAKTVAFEKDIVSAMVGAALNPDADFVNDGFETIDKYLPQLAVNNEQLAVNNEQLAVNNEQLTVNNDPQTGAFDVVASNIPFAQGVKVFDEAWAGDNSKQDDAHHQAAQNLHTYFWMKAMEQLENGGILAFITNRGVADTRSNEYLREWLLSKGNLLAAVRLPDNLFMDGSGVEVGSDLIIFQRDIHKSTNRSVMEQYFLESTTRTMGDVTVENVNRLLSVRNYALYSTFKVEKDQYGKMVFKYRWSEGMDKMQAELTSRLSRDMERNFRRSAWVYGHDTLRQMLDRMMAKTAKKNAKVVKVAKVANAKERAAEIKPLYEQVLESFSKLNQYERVNRKPCPYHRDKMNEQYDEFVSKYGTFHANVEAVRLLPDYQLMLSLERKETDGQYVKADVFDHPTAYRIIDPNTVYTPMDALGISLNERGKVDMPFIMELTKLDEQGVYEALKGEIFWMVDSKTLDCRYLHKSEAICGDVISKRKTCETYLHDKRGLTAFDEVLLNDTIEALKQATPTPIKYEDIDIQLGVRWLPTKYFERFAEHIFKTEPGVQITYTSANDQFLINDGGRRYNANDEGGNYGSYAVKTPREASNRRYCGYDILQYALLDKCPTITWTVCDVKRTDHEGMQMVQKVIDRMRKEFLEFIKSKKITETERREIEQLYNETFNCYVKAHYDGSMQDFPGLDYTTLGFSDLYQSQKDAIFMIKQQYGGVCWHTVGGGKTMIMCVSAFEMHRLGMCNKPIIIGLKANVHQIADTFRKAYPNGRLLYPGPDDFSKAKRVEFFNKIANNDWDCIIMTHDQFGRIPLTPEVQDSIAQDEIAEIEAALDVMREVSGNDKVSKQMIRGLETRKENLEAAIKERAFKLKEKSDDALNFRQLGIDMIFVDEYQAFKNLAFTTRHGRVAGLGNAQGSARATHLLTCIRDIQQQKGRDLCAAFFSGTIITNALTELYVLFKYLRPSELKRQGISCFDAWAAVYMHKSNELELDMCNRLKTKERFRTYLNLPELTQFLRQITDFRSADMINLDIPTRKDIYDLQPPTAEQQMMLERITKFAERGDWSVLGLPDNMKSANLDKSLMLVVTDLARKVALDPRIIDPELFHDDPNNKAHRCAKNIYENYMEFREHRGTQFVFTDLSKYDKDRWNICTEIRDILVRDYGLPSEEITFINLWESSTAKKKLFDKMNNGEIRVIFGSTQKLGTGVNAQQRAVAVHHLDAPWRPSDMEQRDGRAVRHGNEVKIWGNNEVRIYTYGTERTLDSYRFNLIDIKNSFIKSINTTGVVSRHMNEDDMDEDGGMSYAQLKALLSGNEDLLKIAKLEQKIRTLESEQQRFVNQRTEAENAIKSSEKSIDSLTMALNGAERELSIVNENISQASASACIVSHSIAKLVTEAVAANAAANNPIEANDVLIPAAMLTINGAKSQTVGDLGRALKEIYFRKPKQTETIGHYFGMEIKAFTDVKSDTTVFAVATMSNLLRRGNNDGHDQKSLLSSVTYFDGVAPTIQAAINTAKSGIANHEHNIRANRATLANEWDGGTELLRLQAELETLEESVKADLAAKEREREDAMIEEAKKDKRV